MAEVVPPDPFQALGLSRDASDNEIKSAYRKGCLRCHPDKTTDPDKIAEFHRIQQAFNILSDPEKRQKYDDAVRLQQLRREIFNRKTTDDQKRPTTDIKTAVYNYARFDERRPKTSTSPESYDRRRSEDVYSESRSQARKHQDDVEPAPRRASATQKPSAPSSKTSKTTKEQKERDLRARQRERDLERDRSRRFARVSDEDSDDSHSYAGQKMRQRERDADEYRRRQASRSDEDDRDARSSRRDHRGAPPPSAYRAEAFSSENLPTRRDSRSSASRPSTVRQRSSSSRARDLSPPSPRRTTSRRDYPEAPPPLYTSRSNPTDIKLPPRRTQTSDSYDDRSRYPPPKPSLPRAETMPVRPNLSTSDSARRTTSTRKPEHRDTGDSGYGSANVSPQDLYPSTQASAPRAKQYRNSDPDDSDDLPFKSELRRPTTSTRRARSPSPVKRYSSASAVPKYTSSVSAEKERGPPPSRSASYKTQAPPSPQISRRPSLSRSGSSFERRGSSLRREQTMPATTPLASIKTGFSSSAERLFGEVLSSSPTEMSRPSFASRKDSSGVRRVAREASDNPSRRPSHDVDYSPGTRTPTEGVSSSGLGGTSARKRWDEAMRVIQRERERERDNISVRGRGGYETRVN